VEELGRGDGDAGSGAGGFDERLAAVVSETLMLEGQARRFDRMADASRREQAGYGAKHAALAADVERARADIEAAKAELEAARLERRQLEEAEVLRKEVAALPPRWRTTQDIAAAEAEAGELRAEAARLAAAYERRRGQAAQLLALLEEMQRTSGDGGEEEDAAMTPGAAARAAAAGGGGGGDGPTPMEQ